MGGGCYKISDERMGWIEAKKMCEATNSQLLSFQSPEEAESLISFIRRIQVFLAVFLSIWPFGRFLAFLAVILAYMMYIYIFFFSPEEPGLSSGLLEMILTKKMNGSGQVHRENQ